MPAGRVSPAQSSQVCGEFREDWVERLPLRRAGRPSSTETRMRGGRYRSCEDWRGRLETFFPHIFTLSAIATSAHQNPPCP